MSSRPSRTVLVLGLLCLSTAAAALAQPGSAASDVLATDRRWAQSQVKGDLAALGEIYADDLVYVHSDGRVDTRAQMLDRIGKGGLKYQKLELVDPKVRVYGDAAVVNGAFDVVVQVDGAPVNHRVLYVHVYARQQGGWWRTRPHVCLPSPEPGQKLRASLVCWPGRDVTKA
jgi:ketosteroid isomerase-like protein